MAAISPQILLFISKESPTHEFARHQLEMACSHAFKSGKVDIRVVDVGEEPDVTEDYNIEALPTIVIGEKRIIGIPSVEILATYVASALEVKRA